MNKEKRRDFPITGSHKFEISKEANEMMQKCEHTGEDVSEYRGYEPPLVYCLKCGWFKPRINKNESNK